MPGQSGERTSPKVGCRYVRYVNNIHGRTGTLWDSRHKSSLIEADPNLRLCQRYSAWGIVSPATANRVVAERQMDLVMVGRALLANPHWPYQAALELQEEKPSWVLPAPYAHRLAKWRPSA